MKQSLQFAGLVLTTAAVVVGCNQAGNAPASSTTKETTKQTQTSPQTPPGPTAPGAHVDAGPNGAMATDRTPEGDGVEVNVGPNGGVDVDVQGEPIRDRIRERRAERQENLPR